jgi:ribosomal protein S18 acetylase RimI-like enzyme
LGFAEVDTCSLKKDSSKSDLSRPYMYNLAVSKQWQRKGIATALVDACEKFVANMEMPHDDVAIMHYKKMGYSDPSLLAACDEFVANLPQEERWLYLRVRKGNDEAISFYRRLGYEEIDPSSIGITQGDVNSNSAEEGELILMGKFLCMR